MKAVLQKVVDRFFAEITDFEKKEKVEAIEHWCRLNHCHLLDRSHPLFEKLLHIPHPPQWLFVRGALETLGEPFLAIVGTRNPSPYGIRAAREFGRAVSLHGISVVSGLAYGIDSAGHWGCLEGKSPTIAVLGHGLDRVYPACNRFLAEAILDRGGALVSEYPPGLRPQKYFFPERNRLIAGLSYGVLVIEASLKSGSLITAYAGLNQGKDVFVVPSHYDESQFEGSHRLIQEGAVLAMSIDDVVPSDFPRMKKIENVKFPELHNAFRNMGGELDLSELMNSSRDLVSDLNEALKEGVVIEVYPQHYVWVEQACYSIPENLPSATVSLQASL